MSESNSTKNSRPMSSSKNSTPTDTNTKQGQDQGKQRDTMHLTTALCFVTSTTFWLVCLFRYHPNAWYVFQNAFAILAVCFVADNTVACLAPSLKRRQVVVHYFLGLLQNLLYILLFVASPSLFEKVWTSIFFGWYLFTWIIILTQKAEFFFMFRLFYTIHHASAFFVTGSWMIVSPCCFLDDNVFIYRGIVIWLSADIYNVGLNTFRGIWPKTDKNVLRQIKTVVFVMERIHHSIAYFKTLTVPATQHNTLMWVVVGTGLWNDIIDISFQLQSLCKQNREAKQQSEEKCRGSHLEVEVGVEEKEEVMSNATAETESDIELDV